MLLLALSLLCPLISTFEVTVRSAGSVQERQESSVCLYYNAGMLGSFPIIYADRISLTRVGSSSAWCLNNEQCQVATALTPAIIFCGTFGAIPRTTVNDYNPSVACAESCWSVLRIHHALLPHYLPCFAEADISAANPISPRPINSNSATGILLGGAAEQLVVLPPPTPLKT